MAEAKPEEKETRAAGSTGGFPYSQTEIGSLLLLVFYFLLLDILFGRAYYLLDDGYRYFLTSGYGRWPQHLTVIQRLHVWLYRHQELLAVTTCACAACQVMTLLVWSVFLPGSHVLRISSGATLLVVGVAWFAYWSIVDLEKAGGPLVPWAFACFALLLFMIAQLPFWGLRWWFGWRVVREHKVDESLPAARRFGLMHLFGISLFLAVPMAILGTMTQIEGPPRDMVGLVVFFFAFTVGAAIIGVAFLWVTVGSRRPVRGVVSAGVVLFVLVFVGSFVVVILEGPPAFSYFWRGVPEVSAISAGATLAVLAVVAPVTLVFRRLGWRLVRGRVY